MSGAAHVMILGCGRSGTSIFGELFESLPGYVYLSEPDFAWLLAQPFAQPVAVKVPKANAGHPPSPGLSFPLERLLERMPRPRRLFWQVRHPLDAIASLRVGISKGWDHHPPPPDWQDWLDRPLIERCAHHWDHINSVGYDAVREHVEICRFEDQIADPAGFARRTCAAVGLAADDCAPALERWAERVQDTNNEKFVEAKTSRAHSRPDHRVRVGRWRENLDAGDLRAVVPMIAATAGRFGYELPDA